MNIIIVGGGVAGWLAALILSKRQPCHTYTIIESEDVKTIGVGEGTTGLFLHHVIRDIFDITIEEFIRETKATPKVGIEFNDWSEIGSSYFNPIDGSPTRNDIVDASVFFNYIQDSNLDKSSINSILRSKNKTPFYKKPGKLLYYDTAFHLDNAATIQYLKKKALTEVSHIQDTVQEIVRDSDGNVSKVICKDTEVEGDIFIDSTGFSRIFSDESDWVSFKENLPMNSVTTFSRPLEGEPDLVTKANAMNSGWCWEIPTQERYGCGYVYCDEYITEQEAIDEINSVYSDATINRSFKFDSGKLKQSWNNNVISIGLSYHFFEPLQATNIHLTLLQLDALCVKYIRSSKERSVNKYNRNQYNRYIDSLVENFKHYINAHYTGRREDTEFWRYISSKKHYTEFTEEIIESTKNRVMFGSDFPNIVGSAGSQLWVYTILGMEHVDKNECFKLLAEVGMYERGVSKYFEIHNLVEQMEMLSYSELIDRVTSKPKVEILA